MIDVFPGKSGKSKEAFLIREKPLLFGGEVLF